MVNYKVGDCVWYDGCGRGKVVQVHEGVVTCAFGLITTFKSFAEKPDYKKDQIDIDLLVPCLNMDQNFNIGNMVVCMKRGMGIVIAVRKDKMIVEFSKDSTYTYFMDGRENEEDVFPILFRYERFPFLILGNVNE